MKIALLAAGLTLGAVSPALAGEIAVVGLNPPNRARNVCIDASLSITLAGTFRVGESGAIRVHGADGTVVDVIDVADPGSRTRYIGGAEAAGVAYAFNYYPIIVTGKSATVYLHRALEYGTIYYVTVDPRVFVDDEGQAFAGMVDPQGWRFTTRSRQPSVSAKRLAVAADGSGDFCTVQGAIDAVPMNNTQPVVVSVRDGTYTEIVYVRAEKPFITVRGESRDRSVIQYANNNNLNGKTTGRFRAMFGVDAPDFTLENITLRNTTAKGGSQSEAFRGNNQRILLNRVSLSSFQDTLLLQGRAFVTNSYIEGDVDFMWGNGTVFLQHNELKALNPGYYTQIRNTDSRHGNVYVNNRLNRAAGLADDTLFLSRIDPKVYPYSQVVFINTAMGTHVRPAGWLLNTAPSNDCDQAPHIQFWEYHSTDLDGKAIDVSRRLACSRQLTDEEAAKWSDPAFVLDGWVPPTVNAAPASVLAGANVAANWSAPPDRMSTGWVGLFRVDDSDTTPISSWCIGDATTGTMTFTAPSGPGRYELRLFVGDDNGGSTRAATSDAVFVK